MLSIFINKFNLHHCKNLLKCYIIITNTLEVYMSKQKNPNERQHTLLELIAKEQVKKEQPQELPQETSPSDQWIMLPLIPHKAITFITGPDDTDKTRLAIDLAYSVSSGIRFVYFPITRAGNVLYITSEPSSVFQQRVNAMNRVYYGIENFYWMSKQDLSIEKDIEQIRPVLVVIDKIKTNNMYKLLQGCINKYQCGIMVVNNEDSYFLEHSDVVISYSDLLDDKVAINIEKTKIESDYLKFKKINMPLHLFYKNSFHDINHCY